jgi:hypothetical protein
MKTSRPTSGWALQRICSYPNAADASEATAAQSAAHSPSDNRRTTLIAARLVNRKLSPWGSNDED